VTRRRAPWAPRRDRSPGTAATRPRPVQHRDIRDAFRVGEHRQDPRGPDPDETWSARPGPGRRGCLRIRCRPTTRYLRL